MKRGSFVQVVAVSLLVSIIGGCASQNGAPGPRIAGEGRGQKENRQCKWTFDLDPNGKHKIIHGSLTVEDKPGHAGKCGKVEVGPPLYIGSGPNDLKKLVSPPDGEFVTEGTCRHCYFNSAGGMTCVTYPGC